MFDSSIPPGKYHFRPLYSDGRYGGYITAVLTTEDIKLDLEIPVDRLPLLDRIFEDGMKDPHRRLVPLQKSFYHLRRFFVTKDRQPR